MSAFQTRSKPIAQVRPHLYLVKTPTPKTVSPEPVLQAFWSVENGHLTRRWFTE